MPKSKPPRKKRRPTRQRRAGNHPQGEAIDVPARWGRDPTIQHYYDQILAAIQNDDAISAEWASRHLLRRLRPHVEEDVTHARQAGATWAQIGEGLGITSQAAGKRFRTYRESPS